LATNALGLGEGRRIPIAGREEGRWGAVEGALPPPALPMGCPGGGLGAGVGVQLVLQGPEGPVEVQAHLRKMLPAKRGGGLG